MKSKTTAALVGVLAVAAVGGGAAFALTSANEPPAAVATATPEASADPTVSPTPDAPASAVETADPSPAPTPEPTYSEAEGEYLYGAHQLVPVDLGLTDADLLAAGYEVCEQHKAGLSNEAITVIEGLDRIPHNDLNLTATNYLC